MEFLRFTPGLVGGHCISVDPYYLTYVLKKLNTIQRLYFLGEELMKIVLILFFNL